MKQWAPDHPKARLMASKRAAILNAARETFLRAGYEGTSMEGIAATAGVSIMTLYRHASSKDDLFAAVILNACDYAEETRQAEQAALMPKPLEDVLVHVGLAFQNKLLDTDTIALLRTVIAEVGRFPQLADTAYQGLMNAYEDNLADFLSKRREAASLKAAARRRLCRTFLDHLIGKDVLRALLGLGTIGASERRKRARYAAQEFLSDLYSAGSVAEAG